jgi:3-oxoacyl-[acyl-carrier protein] reductase
MARIERINRAETVERPLEKAIALVTGASMGAAVAICGRDEKALAATAEAIREEGAWTFYQVADITRASEINNLVEKTQTTLGAISILVNNAGIGLFGATHEKSEADWNRVLDTNLKGVFLVSKAVIPGMIKRGGGDIINISSLAGKNTFAGGGIYCASKWGLQGLSGCMAEDLREHGIRVSLVCPGSVATEFSSRQKNPEKALRAEDVAHAVAMLVTQRDGSFVSEVDVRPLRKG